MYSNSRAIRPTSVAFGVGDEELHDFISPDKGVGRLASEAEDLSGLSPVQVVAAREAMALGEGLRRRIVVLDELEDRSRWARVARARERAVSGYDRPGVAHVPSRQDLIALGSGDAIEVNQGVQSPLHREDRDLARGYATAAPHPGVAAKRAPRASCGRDRGEVVGVVAKEAIGHVPSLRKARHVNALRVGVQPRDGKLDEAEHLWIVGRRGPGG